MDEPMFDIKLKKELGSVIDFLIETDMELGIHCCSKLEMTDLVGLKLDYLSIDCTLYGQQELLRILELETNLISGIVSTVSGDISFKNETVLKASKYISPSCGLALSKINVCHKALSNLSHLRSLDKII